MASIIKRGEKYHAKFYFRGRQYFRSLHTTDEQDAVHATTALERNIHLVKTGTLNLPENVDVGDFLLRGKVEAPAEPPDVQNPVSVRSLVEEYLRASEPPRKAPSSFATEKIHLQHFQKFLAGAEQTPVTKVNAGLIERYVSARKKKVGANTINKELQTLRQLFSFALVHGHLAANPLDAVTRLKQAGIPHRFMTKEEIDKVIKRGRLNEEEKKELLRFRYLTPDEVGELLKLARDSYLYPVLAVLVYAGMRRGELLGLRWQDVDVEGKKIWARSRKQSRTKEYTARDIDMHPSLVNIMKRHMSANPEGSYVFSNEELNPLSPDKLWRDFQTLVEGTPFEGIGFHCLRHTFASNLARAGVDDRIIDHFMGHQTDEMRRRYQHLFPDRKQSAIRSLPY